MKTIELIRLEIKKFKGISEKEIRFDGKNAEVYGANATGKSTLSDAFSWLLFGKNAAGETDFEIKPRGADGALLYPGSQTEVTADLRIDGEMLTLTRIFKEIWTTPRGRADAVYSGNTTEYFIDGFPVKKSEYDGKIHSFANEKIFRLVSSVGAFFKMTPKEQREILFDLTGTVSDYELATANPEYAELAEELKEHSIEDVRKKIAYDRKKISENRNGIPARLDELNRSRAGIASIDFSKAKKESAILREEKAKLEEEKSGINFKESILKIESEIKRVEADLEKLELENKIHKNAQSAGNSFLHEKMLHRDRIDLLERNAQRVEAQITRKKSDIFFTEDKIQLLREDYSDEEKKKPVFGKECPTCKRPYEEDALRAAEAKFNAEKKAALKEICEKAKEYTVVLEKQKEELLEAEKEKAGIFAEIEKSKANLAEVEEKEKAESVQPSDLPEYGVRREALLAEKLGLEMMLDSVHQQTAEKLSEINGKIEDITSKIYLLDKDIANEEVLCAANNRIRELEEISRKWGAQIEELDRKAFLCESYVKHKVSVIEQSINGKFEITTFKLFKEQVNGGIADTCEAMRDGIPYSDLNTGSRVNVGIDVANTLSAAYGVCVPLFIDNAEGVTEMITPMAQTVKLFVSANDKELRVNVNEFED